MKSFLESKIKKKIKEKCIYLKRHFFKYTIFVIFLSFEYLSIPRQEIISTNSHYIFTFWEPHHSIPGYLSLCMKTWRKNIPDNYNIIILDYSNLQDYLSSKLLNQILCKNMTLQIQADAIRVAILYKYGGFWMDVDTLIINHNFMNMFSGSDLIMFGISKIKQQHIGFIYASNNSKILKAWLKGIIYKIRIYEFRLSLSRIFKTQYFEQSINQLRNWSYLGNGILDDLVNNIPEREFKRIEDNDAYVLPDQILLKGFNIYRYTQFYFSKKITMQFLKKCKGVILLHNSWTPKKYQKMSEELFLRQNILLSHLISNILNNTN
jgi:hypothetical protein